MKKEIINNKRNTIYLILSIIGIIFIIMITIGSALAVIEDGIILSYDFNQNGTLTDTYSNTYNLTKTGTQTLLTPTGVLNGCINFSNTPGSGAGATQYYSGGVGSKLTFNQQNFTMSVRASFFQDYAGESLDKLARFMSYGTGSTQWYSMGGGALAAFGTGNKFFVNIVDTSNTVIDYSGASINLTGFHTYTFRKTSTTNLETLIDGVSIENNSVSQNFVGANMLYIATLYAETGAPMQGFQGCMDEIIFWNRSITDSEIQQSLSYSYGKTTVVTPVYNVTLSQFPLDINTSLIGFVNYNATINIISDGNVTNSSNASLFYRMNTSLNGGCARFENGLCTDNTWKNVTMTKVNNTFFNSSIRELNIFPGYYPFYQDWVDNQNTTYNYSLYLNNNIKFIVQNFSTYTNPFLSMEFDGNNISSSSVMSIYYCNSSYTSGIPSTNTNCELVQTIIPSGLTNYHYHGNHRHYVLPIAISTVTKTQNSSFIFYSTQTIANGWRMEYLLNNSYNNQSFQTGSETAWSSTPNIFDIHLHQFLTNDSFQTKVVFNDGSGNQKNSSIYTDFLEATNQPPTTPSIFKPSGSEKITLSYNSNTSIIFQWTQPRDFENDALTYSLYLTNGLTDYYIFTNLTNSSFTNNTYNASISRNDIIPAPYNTRLYVCDNHSNCVTGSGSIILCSNNYYNVSGVCVSGASLQTVIDLNGCDTLLDFPYAWNNTYNSCTVPPTEIKTVYNDDMLVLIILGFFLILAIILAITVHEGFFGLSALIVALMMATFLYYDYPDILVYFSVFMIILLSTMWIIIARKR